MRKLTILGLMLLFTMSSVLTPTAQAQFGDTVTNSLDWLREQQEDNGSYDDEIGATALATFAFASAEDVNASALEWLGSQSYSEVGLDEVSLALIALVANDQDVATFANGDILARHSALMRADLELQNTDALCLGLVARYNLDIPIQEEMLVEVFARQNDDGGFGVTTDAPSDVTTTSLCIHVFAVTDSAGYLGGSLDFLRDTQLEDDGWQIGTDNLDAGQNDNSDPLATSFAMLALIAADEPLSDWGNPERTLILFADEATGAFVFPGVGDNFTNTISTISAVPVFQGLSLNSFAPAEAAINTANSTDDADGAPTLDANWKLVGDGFGIELDSADDFFVTVVDPFTDEELSGVEIINWTAAYSYTGYIVESHLTAEMLLWMNAQDDTVLQDISTEALALMSAEELSQLPEAVQARVNNASE